MAKNLGGAIIDLLDSERVELRTAAATVLAAVGKGDRSVEAALIARLGDPDGEVRRIALDALADMRAPGIAPGLVPLLRGDDEALAQRARDLLAENAADAEATLCKEIATGPVHARRVMAQLLLHRGTRAALDAVLDQLADDELGEHALQLVRAELDRAEHAARAASPATPAGQAPRRAGKAVRKPGPHDFAALLDRSATARVVAADKALVKAWAQAQRAADPGRKHQKEKAGKPGRSGTSGKAAPSGSNGTPGQAASAEPAGSPASPDPGHDPTPDPLRDPAVVRATAALGNLLRLIGYVARPENQALLLRHAAAGQPQPIRLAAISGLRRIVAHADTQATEQATGKATDKVTGKATDKVTNKVTRKATDKATDKVTDKVIEALIELAGGDDPAVVQAAVDTLQGARIPDALAKPFAALARSHNAAAQKLAMERMPAGVGAEGVKTLIDALAGDDPAARDAAARGLGRAPEAMVLVTRALLATGDEQIARRYAGVLRSYRGQPSPPAAQAVDELVDRAHKDMERHARGNATADQIVLERVIAELIADLAPVRHVELLFDRARRLRKTGKTIEAFGSLKPLLRSRADIDAAIDDDQRFLLAVLALEVAGNGLIRATRTDDPVFEQFARLAAKGFPVATRLAREADVADEAIYALGFRLLESGDGAHEDLGAELLQGIIDERPRSKLATAARNKLKLTGHLDEDAAS